MTLERVIYARKGGLALEAPHTPLGVAGEGAWALVSDETLLALLAASRPLRILYFHGEEYGRAMRGLPPPEVERAVRRRLEVFADRVAGETLAAMMDQERTSLAFAAAARQRGYVDACLGRLARLYGNGYLDLMAAADVVRIGVVDEAMLAEIEADAGDAAAAARRRTQATELAQARARLGENDYARALPYVDPTLVFAVTPVRTERLDALDHDKVPHLVLDGRLLVALPRRAREQLAADGTVTRLGDAGEFVELLDGTAAQRERDLREWVARANDPVAAATARWQRRASQCVHKRWMAGDPRSDAALVAALGRQLDADVAELMASAPPAAAGATLAESHARAEADARLHAILARQSGLSSLARDFDDELAALAAARP